MDTVLNKRKRDWSKGFRLLPKGEVWCKNFLSNSSPVHESLDLGPSCVFSAVAFLNSKCPSPSCVLIQILFTLSPLSSVRILSIRLAYFNFFCFRVPIAFCVRTIEFNCKRIIIKIQILMQYIWGGAQCSASLTSSQVREMQLVPESFCMMHSISLLIPKYLLWRYLDVWASSGVTYKMPVLGYFSLDILFICKHGDFFLPHKICIMLVEDNIC